MGNAGGRARSASTQPHGVGLLDAPLHFAVECRTAGQVGRGPLHRVTIRPDWAVSTPHDLDAERVAAAFGPATSCLDLVERTIPALREAMPLLTRRARLPLRRDRRGAWRLPPSIAPMGCCRGTGFPTAETLARHTRSAEHLAAHTRVPQWQLASVMSAMESAWGAWEGEAPAAEGLERCVREPGGVDLLWSAGIHPDDLPSLAEPAAGVSGALPVSYFLGMAYGGADPRWIADALPEGADADTAAWLTRLESPSKVASAAEWRTWLRFGLPRDDVRHALAAGLGSDHVRGLALDTGWSIPTAARLAVAWAKIGCLPSAAHLTALARAGVDHAVPSRAAVDSLVHDVRQATGIDAEAAPARTELGVLLAVLGTRTAVVRAFASGIRNALDGVPHAASVPDDLLRTTPTTPTR